MDFQTRARLADAALWPVMTAQLGKLDDPKDIEAVISGAVIALTRLVWHTTADPSVTQTVELIREMSCASAIAVQTEAEALKR